MLPCTDKAQLSLYVLALRQVWFNWYYGWVKLASHWSAFTFTLLNEFVILAQLYFVVSDSDFQYDTTQWYDNFIITTATEITKQLRLSNSFVYPINGFFIFATEITKN